MYTVYGIWGLLAHYYIIAFITLRKETRMMLGLTYLGLGPPRAIKINRRGHQMIKLMKNNTCLTKWCHCKLNTFGFWLLTGSEKECEVNFSLFIKVLETKWLTKYLKRCLHLNCGPCSRLGYCNVTYCCHAVDLIQSQLQQLLITTLSHQFECRLLEAQLVLEQQGGYMSDTLERKKKGGGE